MFFSRNYVAFSEREWENEKKNVLSLIFSIESCKIWINVYVAQLKQIALIVRRNRKKRNATAQDHLDWSCEVDRELFAAFNLNSYHANHQFIHLKRCAIYSQSQSNLKLSTLRKVKLSSSLLVLTAKLLGIINEAISMKLRRRKHFFGF